jgi:GNAT superfamily N-acetyltransferase
MAREQLRRLAERELRPYRAEDEPAVLALWARALPRWPVSAEAFRSRVIGAEQLVMVADGGLAGYISVARAQLTAILVDPACRRAGLGSQLLAQARRNLGGVKLWFAGSGAGPEFLAGRTRGCTGRLGVPAGSRFRADRRDGRPARGHCPVSGARVGSGPNRRRCALRACGRGRRSGGDCPAGAPFPGLEGVLRASAGGPRHRPGRSRRRADRRDVYGRGPSRI